MEELEMAVCHYPAEGTKPEKYCNNKNSFFQVWKEAII